MADLLSKIKIGEKVYDLKDAKARADIGTLLGNHALEALKSAAWVDVATAVADNNGNLPTTAQVKSYVDAQIGTINKFDVVVDNEGTASGPSLDPIAANMYKLVLVPDAKAASGSYIEYILIRSGAAEPYTYAWEKIGSTKADLSDYLTDEATVAGVAFGDDKAISDTELKTALDLKNFAHVDKGEVDIPSQTVTGLKASGSFTPTLKGALGEAAAEATITTKAAYTPAGTIAAKAGGSFSALKSVALEADDNGAFQPAGTISKPDITITPTAGTVKAVKSVGTLPSFTEGQFTEGSFTKGTAVAANTDAMKMHVAAGAEIAGDVTAETLIIEPAATDNVMDYDATYVSAKKNADTWDAGTLPESENASVLASVAAELAATPVFTGAKYAINTTADTALKDVEFSGTTTANLIPTAISYQKTDIGTLAINEVSLTGNNALAVNDVVVPAQNNLEVTPKASA